MKKYLYLHILILFACLSSCNKHDPVYYQFTDDEKKWIFYQNSNPIYAVYDFDTLINTSGGDSIVIKRMQDVQAVVESHEYEDNYEKDNTLYYCAWGRAQLSPNLFLPPYSYFLGYCTVDASKYDGSLHISIDLVGIYNEKIDISNTLDTALVQGNIFTDVYKYIDTSTNYKCIYLAKNYGFIKIELEDGRKIELIN